MNRSVFVPRGGASRLAIQACSRLPDPERGLGFQKGVYHNVEPVVMAGTCLRETAIGLPGDKGELNHGAVYIIDKLIGD